MVMLSYRRIFGVAFQGGLISENRTNKDQRSRYTYLHTEKSQPPVYVP
jgi:hypothetical protein